MDRWRVIGVFVVSAALAWSLGGAMFEEPAPSAEPQTVASTPQSRASAKPAPFRAPAPAPRAASRGAEPDPQLAPEASETAPTREPTDPEYAQLCERSDTCADGRACVDGTCQHCIADDECEGELLCARSRCVAPEDLACTRDEDCGVDSFCVEDVRAHGPPRRRHVTVCTAEVEGDRARLD